MSRYTTKGSAQLDEKIDSDLKRIEDLTAPYTSAGILMGGYGRGEGTPFIHPDESQSPFNDYDLIVIVDECSASVCQKLHALEKQLRAELCLTVDLYPYALTKLPRCEFSLLNYELKYGHKVIWGDPGILDTLPDYAHHAIPLSEGTRLLMNRGKLLLDIQQRIARPEPLRADERIRFIKFIYKMQLAFGDCALLTEGKYTISYAEKNKRIVTLGDFPDRDRIIRDYQNAVALKEWGDFEALHDFDITGEFNRVRELFLRFFPWYRSQYSARECSPAKALALNLRWNGWPLFSHPRLRLYDALQQLLTDDPDPILLGQILFCHNHFVEKFYTLQRRFS